MSCLVKPRPLTLIIAGSRDLEDYGAVCDAFAQFATEHFWPDVIFHGQCSGADMLGDRLAEEQDITVRTFPVYSGDWDRHGKAAGPMRNQRMVDEADGLVVVRFKDSRGSADVLKRARKKGIPVVDVVLERPAEDQ